jgi:hypothetical protein
MSADEPQYGYVIRDINSGQYLVHASIAGTTWTADRAGARSYPTREAAEAATKYARWLDYDPEVVLA